MVPDFVALHPGYGFCNGNGMRKKSRLPAGSGLCQQGRIQKLHTHPKYSRAIFSILRTGSAAPQSS